MPDYRFTIHGDQEAPEPVTVTLPDDFGAWDYGESLVRSLLGTDGKRDSWILEITEADREIATMGFDLAALRKGRTLQ